MATYKKRGGKPRTKLDKQQSIEDGSTTAEVFNTLDEGLQKLSSGLLQIKNIFLIVGFQHLLFWDFLDMINLSNSLKSKAMNDMYTAQVF